jgi:uncharacterized membrane protein YhaH (DUF805 family)
MPLRPLLARYADFEGRMSRRSFWLLVGALAAASLICGAADGVLGLAPVVGPLGPLALVCLLVTLVPSLAAEARRLHDVDRPAWWLLLVFVPLAGFCVLIFLCALEGTAGPNAYGEDPRQP